MAKKVLVNKRTVVNKKSKGIAIGFPDVCKFPMPSPSGITPVPLPFPNFALSMQADGCASSVKVEGEPIMTSESTISMSYGDCMGNLGGIISTMNDSMAWPCNYSRDVTVEGNGVFRALDPMILNLINTMGFMIQGSISLSDLSDMAAGAVSGLQNATEKVGNLAVGLATNPAETLKTNSMLQAVASSYAGKFGGPVGTAVGGGSYTAIIAYLNGESIEDALKKGVISGTISYACSQLPAEGFADRAQKVVVVGTLHGISAVIDGRSFDEGFEEGAKGEIIAQSSTAAIKATGAKGISKVLVNGTVKGVAYQVDGKPFDEGFTLGVAEETGRQMGEAMGEAHLENLRRDEEKERERKKREAEENDKKEQENRNKEVAAIVDARNAKKQQQKEENKKDKSTDKGGSLQNDLKSALIGETCTQAEPISMITGEELLELTDFSLPGPFPFEFKRVYRTGHNRDKGLGHGWSCLYLVRLVIDNTQVVFEDAEGRFVRFEKPAPGARCIQTAEKMILTCSPNHKTTDNPPNPVDVTQDRFDYQLQLKDGNVLTFIGYGAIKKLFEVEDKRYNKHLLFYDKKGRLEKIVDSTERVLLLRYTNENRLADIRLEKQTAPLGENNKNGEKAAILTAYQYDEHGNLIKAQDALEQSEQYRYRNHLIIERTLKTGYKVYWQWDRYDINGRCLRQWGDQGRYDYHFEYFPDKKLTLCKDGRGVEQMFLYNEAGQIVMETDGRGQETHNRYDRLGRLRTTVDPSGNITEYDYPNIGGYIVNVKNPLGQTTRYSYSQNGDWVKITGPDGANWRRGFDISGNITALTDPRGYTTEYKYHQNGLLQSTTDAVGNRRCYEYNSKGERVSQSDVLRGKTTFKYDFKGNLIKAIKEDGSTTTIKYDALGRATGFIFPGDVTIFLEYDAANNITRYTDPRGNTTVCEYNGLTQITQKIQPDGSFLKYEYDPECNLTTIINEKGEKHRLVYDENERLIKETGFDDRTQKYVYNASGHLIQLIDEDEKTTRYERDALGRMTSRTTSDQDTCWFDYDESSNLISAWNSLRKVDYSYNTLGNIISERQYTGADDINYRLFHTYDPLGRKIKTILPDNRTIKYEYSDSGGLKKVLIDNQAIASYETDSLGREIKRITDAIETLKSYHSTGRLESLSVSRQSDRFPISQKDYQYDPTGNLERIIEFKNTPTVSQRETTAYSYDPLDRLYKVDGPIFERFRIDPAGNISAVKQTTGPILNTPSIQGNRLLEHQNTRLKYDSSGNRTEQKQNGVTTHYIYNHTHKLIEVQTPDNAVKFTYDALGRRITKADKSGTTTYFWNQDVLLQEIRTTNEKPTLPDETWYLFEPTGFKPLAQIKNDTIYHYHLDHLGTPHLMTNPKGEIAWQTDCHAYGKVNKYKTQKTENPLRFQGQYLDTETGLHYNRHRYYDPETGRYLQQDPIGLKGGLNPYVYGKNPISWVDPLGLKGKAHFSGGPLSFVANSIFAFGESIVDGLDAVGNYIKKTTEPTVEKATEVIDEYALVERGLGVLQVTGGVGEIALGIVGVATPEPATTVIGVVGVAHGADTLSSGLTQVVTGKYQSTLTEKGITATAKALGADPTTASNIGTAGDTIVGLTNPANLGRKALQKGARKTAQQTTKVAPKIEKVSSSTASNLKEGSFSIKDWSGYPDGVPKPEGTFRLLKGEEYKAARKVANKANTKIHKANPQLKGQQIHEIKPVKFDGSPTNVENKVPLKPKEHQKYTNWWNKLQRDITK